MKKQPGKLRAWCIRKLGGYAYELPKERNVTMYTMPVEKICDMFMHVMRDECPCNYCGVDEWLPEACELIDECPNPSDKMGCWKQFIKHYPNRLDYMDGAAMEAEQMRVDGRREEEHNAVD